MRPAAASGADGWRDSPIASQAGSRGRSRSLRPTARSSPRNARPPPIRRGRATCDAGGPTEVNLLATGRAAPPRCSPPGGWPPARPLTWGHSTVIAHRLARSGSRSSRVANRSGRRVVPRGTSATRRGLRWVSRRHRANRRPGHHVHAVRVPGPRRSDAAPVIGTHPRRKLAHVAAGAGQGGACPRSESAAHALRSNPGPTPPATGSELRRPVRG
jgi:hypothetical protein